VLPFAQIWAVDFEFNAHAGARPDPICLVARELHGGQIIRLWHDQFGPEPPYPTGADALFVAYYASAELGCHLALGWPMPARILDLYVEFRHRTNGGATPFGRGLLGALAYFGLEHIGVTEKEEMQTLAMRGGPWTADERQALLDYCETDVDALARLLPAMASRIDLPRALLRGRYMAAIAAMEHNGVPIDVAALECLGKSWRCIQDQLIADIDTAYGVFEGRTFKQDRFEALLAREGIPWPRLESGRLDLADDTFREMAKSYARISPLRGLRSALSEMRLSDLSAGRDGRNRTLLSPFASRTGRNQPSNTKFIFGPSVWLRGLVRPEPGFGLAYVDYSQQEFGIAAALSGDTAMQAAYDSGDPYLAFAKQARMVPEDATKQTHESQRGLCKQCVRGTQYGMGPETLASRIGQAPIVARDLLRAHRETYPRFWRWSDAALDHAMFHGSLQTAFGWRISIGADANPRSLRNFPMQANGSEMLRLACCIGTERGIEICAPVHDAVLIRAPLDRLEADIHTMQAAMAEASRIVLAGFELRSDSKAIRAPDRYMDARGKVMWERVWSLMGTPVERAVA
jgi:DNA polymerase I